MAFLRTLKGPEPGRVYRLSEVDVLGRLPECDIVLDVGAISRQHARITRVGSDYYVEDLKSRNGTFVNGARVEGQHKLAEKDELKICDVIFAFHEKNPEDVSGAVLQTLDAVQMVDDEAGAAGSTIMSKLEVSTGSTSLRLAVNPEVKLKALLEIGRNLGGAVRIEEVLPRLLENLFKIFIQADRGFIALLEPGTERLVTKAVRHRREEAGGRIRMSRTIVNSAIAKKEAILSADASADSQFAMSESVVDFQIHSVMCAPLVDSTGDVLGVIQVDTTDARRRFSRDDLDVLASVACQAAVTVENAQLHEVAVRQELLQRELELAHRVQRGLLPASPPQVERYEFFHFYEPAHQLGGDYFDYVPLSGNRLASAMADVCGKGVAAALLVARLSAEVRYCLASLPQPVDAVQRLNEVFCDNRWEGKFVTMVLAVIDVIRHEICIVNAGHMAPLLRRASGAVEEVDQLRGGFPLGIEFESSYQQFSIPLATGESLIMYTDGVIDAENRNSERYDTQRLIANLQRPSPDVTAMGQSVIGEVKRFIGDHPQVDDICFTAVRRIA